MIEVFGGDENDGMECKFIDDEVVEYELLFRLGCWFLVEDVAMRI